MEDYVEPALKVLGSRAENGIVLVDVSFPFKEEWLLEDVVERMLKHNIGVTTISGVGGYTDHIYCPLLAIPRSSIEKWRTDGISYLSGVLENVAQNEEIVVHIEQSKDLIQLHNGYDYVRFASTMKRPMRLCGDVSVICDNAELTAEQIEEIGDSRRTIAVDRITPSVENMGVDYHFSNREDELVNTEYYKRVCSHPHAEREGYAMSRYAVTPACNMMFSCFGISMSNSLKAVLWAITNGADHVNVYGFNGRKNEHNLIDYITSDCRTITLH